MRFFAVIPTYNRPDELHNLVTQLIDQDVNRRDILIINNGNKIPLVHREIVTVIEDTERSPHIYGQWNLGLNWAEDGCSDSNSVPGRIVPHTVAILNDDVELPDNFVSEMTRTIADTGCTIAFPNQGPGIVNAPSSLGPGSSPQRRITGYAFVVNGRSGIRCDERFKWWYGDDDLDWRARRNYAGTFEVPGVTVKHLYPSESTNASPERLAQAALDRETFIKKWGKAPW